MSVPTNIPSVLALAMCVVAGCAHAPTQQLSRSRASVRAAKEVGAVDVPKAAYHLNLAQDQISIAEPLMEGNRDDKRSAERLLMRAEVDADLAIEFTNATRKQAEAAAEWAKVRDLVVDEE